MKQKMKAFIMEIKGGCDHPGHHASSDGWVQAFEDEAGWLLDELPDTRTRRLEEYIETHPGHDEDTAWEAIVDRTAKRFADFAEGIIDKGLELDLPPDVILNTAISFTFPQSEEQMETTGEWNIYAGEDRPTALTGDDVKCSVMCPQCRRHIVGKPGETVNCPCGVRYNLPNM